MVEVRSRKRTAEPQPTVEVAVWQQKQPRPIVKLSDADLTVYLHQFEKVCTMLTFNADEAVDVAWVWTNNIEKAWYDRVRSNFTVLKRPCRSTMTGDMVEVNGKFWMIDFMGQREATVLQPVARRRSRG